MSEPIGSLAPEGACAAEDDVWIAERIRSGDVAAEDDFARRFRPRIFVMLQARTSDAEGARDLTQETLMAALIAIRKGQLHDATKLPAFVYGVAKNHANQFLRARGREPERVELTPETAWVDARDEVVAAERVRIVKKALARLDATDRRLLRLSIVDRRSAEEIGRELGLTSEAVRARKSRAIKKAVEWVEHWMSHGRRVHNPHAGDWR